MRSGGAMFEFGAFRFDAADETLTQGGQAVPLTRRAAQVLALLLRNRGVVLSREQIEAEVWGETFVDANNLHQQIATLRKVLGSEWIETVPRRGYRFLPPPPPPGEHAPTPRVRSFPRSALAGAFAVVALASCIILYQHQSRPSPIGADSIAILPLKPIGQVEDYICLGLTDALITKLSTARTIDVRPLSAVHRYRDLDADAVTAGRRLHVDAVLDGTVQRDSDRIRMTFRLIEVASGRQVWSEIYEEPIGDLFAVQDRISTAVAEAFSLRLAPRALEKRYASVDPFVMEMYLRGRHHFARRERADFARSIECFQKALARDPSFAPAWVGLGDSLNFTGRVAEAKQAARRALEIDPTLGDAHATLGNALFFFDRDLDAAEREFQLAIERNPSGTNARHWYAYLLMVRGRRDEAMREIQHARRIDPLSIPIASSVGTLLYLDNRFDEAIAAYRRAAELDPDYPQVQVELGLAYAAKGDIERAIEAIHRSNVAEYQQPETPHYAFLAALRGDRAAAERSLARVFARARQGDGQPRDPITIAATFVRLGKPEAAIHWLSQAVTQGGSDTLLLGLDPRFASLRTSPRFRELLNEVFRG